MIHDCVQRLVEVGIQRDDAEALQRISMTLDRWHELECGDGNEYASWAIERDETTDRPYMVRYPHHSDKPQRSPIPDREKGALKRLDKIMSHYPTLTAYVQGDPRGAALYILRPGDVPEGERAESWYSRGVAVYR